MISVGHIYMDVLCGECGSKALGSILPSPEGCHSQQHVRDTSPQVSEDDVAVQVGELAEHGKGDGDVSERERGGCVEGMVQKVAHKHSERPIVAAVSEEVGDGHGAVTKAVDEVRLQNAFGVVEGPVRNSDGLRGLSGL